MEESEDFASIFCVWTAEKQMNESCQYKVSVIIPVYGVEKFVERCVRSLMDQTLVGVEYIFVDDATPDHSMEIIKRVLEEYPQRKKHVQIIHHLQNLGLPAARNSGLRIAKGEYVFHCDSDDYADSDMLQVMYGLAKVRDCDIVWVDWFLTYADTERYMKQPAFEESMDALKAMLCGGMKYNVWNKLVRRSLYTENHIEFPAGYGMGEDMTMMMLFAFSKKVAYLPKAFYHYVKTNAISFSQTYSEKHKKELYHNVQRILDFMYARYGKLLDKELHFFRLETKFPLLTIGTSQENYRLWTALYPESNKYIWANRYISLRSRIIQWCAWRRQWWLVRVYYNLIINGLYRMIYK